MSDKNKDARGKKPKGRVEDRFRAAEAASGIGAFEYDLESKRWDWAPGVALLFGLSPNKAPDSLQEWQRAIFVYDLAKVHKALEAARKGGFYVEFRVMRDGVYHWLAGKGQTDGNVLRGTFYDIGDRKQ